MNSLTLLVCIVAVAVIPEFVISAGKKFKPCETDLNGTCQKECKEGEVYKGQKGCHKRKKPMCCVGGEGGDGGDGDGGGGDGGGEKPPSGKPTYDTSGKSEGLSSGGPEDPPARSSALHSGCFIMYTLTSKGTYSGTNALFSFQFWKCCWQYSPWQAENNPGDDREEEHWDLYGPYPQGIGGLPADWIYVRQTTRPWDKWQIKTIFMKDVCHNKLYEYYCNGCWVSNNPNGGTWIKR